MHIGEANIPNITIELSDEVVDSLGLDTVDLRGDTDAAGTNIVDLGETLGNTLTVYGSEGNDTITTGTGNDFIYGGDGNDTITGGGGADILNGGDGVNTFVFASGSSAGREFEDADVIEDFEPGIDKIDTGTSPMVSIVDGVIDFATFLVDAQDALDGELQNGSVYARTNVNGIGDAYIFMDTNANGNVDASDSFVVLIGVFDGLAVLDFVGGTGVA